MCVSYKFIYLLEPAEEVDGVAGTAAVTTAAAGPLEYQL